ncbi:amidohydrolase 2 [Karstenula rhodostoma CBS 690.94]|uniref:6-methylsalicylate decarboxylase n=1 Tax=Karstenula rhodostoma CBS 690.94 TaxID=1392251 RepID=A0A9P4UFE7_9PLEO|nr:amidohydrolase 2 [Karstenula rhodostoma CBS 690.94]
MALPPRIDVHSHFLPPFYHDALLANGHEKVDGMPAIPEWSLEGHLALMSTANITKAILSISSPGTTLRPDTPPSEAKSLTRKCNAYAADLKRRYPEKFGFWASLPLPDVQAALEEIDKAREDGCDGFALMTNYHGFYLGDPVFDSVFARFNEIHATVFIHPTAPCLQCSHGAPTPALPFGDQYPIPVFEFIFDSARAVIHLFFSGTVDRCPEVTFVLPHAGGVLPPLLTRFTAFGALVPGSRGIDAKEVRRQLGEQFYFDLAGAVFEGDEGVVGSGQLKALVKGFDISHERLLYGSDFPFTRHASAMLLANRMKDGMEVLFNEKEREAIYQGNAERLLREETSKGSTSGAKAGLDRE